MSDEQQKQLLTQLAKSFIRTQYNIRFFLYEEEKAGRKKEQTIRDRLGLDSEGNLQRPLTGSDVDAKDVKDLYDIYSRQARFARIQDSITTELVGVHEKGVVVDSDLEGTKYAVEDKKKYEDKYSRSLEQMQAADNLRKDVERLQKEEKKKAKAKAAVTAQANIFGK